MMTLRPARALASATLRSYRNALRRSFAANPIATTSAVLVAACSVLLIAAFQLQAIMPFIASRSLHQLTGAQIEQVGLASLTGLAAVSWGVALIFETLGFQSAGLAATAASHGVSALQRTLGQAAPVVLLAGLASFALIGPSSFAALYRSLLFFGHTSAAPALALACLLAGTVLVSTALSALAVTHLVGLVSHRDPRSSEIRGVAAALSGGLLITGIGLVLAGRAWGIYVLAPPLAVTGGIPRTASAVGLAVAAAAGYWVVLVALIARQGSSVVGSGGIGARLAWLRLPDTMSTVELRQSFRDPICLSSTLIALAGSVATGVLVRAVTLEVGSAFLVLYGLVTLSSLTPCVAAFRAATTGWLYTARPHGYVQWYRGAAMGQVAASALVAVACRVATTLPPQAHSDSVLLCIAVSAAMLALVSGMLVSRPGVSRESRLELFGGGIVAAITVLAVLVPTMKYAVFNHATVTAGYLLSVALLAALLGDAIVRARSRNRTAEHARA